MNAPRVSDHALVRFLQRAGGIDVEQLRADIAESLAKAHDAALSIGGGDYLVLAHELVFVVRDGVVTSVSNDTGGPGRRFREARMLLDHPGRD